MSRLPLRIRSLALAAMAGPAIALFPAEGHSGPKRGAHAHGVAYLDVDISGSEVSVELFAPGASMLGFEHEPETDTDIETLRLARQNLKAGDAMIRFNTSAGCRLTEAAVQMQRAKPLAGEPPEVVHMDLAAFYTFDCAQPDALDSAAVGLFMGFPALRRALVRYRMETGEGAAELTRGNPVVNFIPF